MNNTWSAVLDSCPGLLCCVINLKGKLLYASNGYKAVAARIFGHKCTEGTNYPPLITELDRAFHEVLTAACLGETNAIEITEHKTVWELTAAPLRVNPKKIEGVVIRINSEIQNNSSKNIPPVIQSNPDILEAVPFRACVVNSKGLILACNKFLSASSEGNLTGKNIIEVFKPVSNFSIMKIISKRSGTVEGRIPELYIEKNFCSDLYLDENLNEIQNEQSEDFRTVKIHAGPVKWNDLECVMLTFEDVTEIKRTHEQLRRILTFDASTGILNRRGIEHAILKEFGKAIRNGDDLSLIMININNFTALNEARGYSAGNKIIRSFLSVVKNTLENKYKSVIARWSTDKFLIMSHCPGATAVVLADKIREKVSDFTISVGIADLNSGNYAGINDFIGAAYNAMTEAKISGKNSTVSAK